MREPSMPAKNNDGDFIDLDQTQPALELFGAIAHEARPVFGTRNHACNADIIWQPLHTPSEKVSLVQRIR